MDEPSDTVPPPLPARPRDGRGASAVEYGLLVSGIAALIAVIVLAFGDNVRDMFDDTCKSVASAADCASD